MEIQFLNNLKSGLIKKEVIKGLDKLDPSLLVPAMDNILDSIGIVDKPKQKDKSEIKQSIKNKLMELIRSLDD